MSYASIIKQIRHKIYESLLLLEIPLDLLAIIFDYGNVNMMIFIKVLTIKCESSELLLGDLKSRYYISTGISGHRERQHMYFHIYALGFSKIHILAAFEYIDCGNFTGLVDIAIKKKERPLLGRYRPYEYIARLSITIDMMMALRATKLLMRYVRRAAAASEKPIQHYRGSR